VWYINASDVTYLQGNDERFTEFVDALIRADMFIASLPDASIKTNLRTRISDGGVDTELTAPIPSASGGLCQNPTCWQYKARPYANVSVKERGEDPCKPYAKNLISSGYAYRLCVADDMPPQTKADWETELDQTIRNIEATAPPPKVVTASDLAAWANRYPTIVARFFRPQLFNLLHLDSWGPNAVAVTRNYVPVAQWAETERLLLAHTDLGKPVQDPVLRIQGEAGVGKTRLVYETLSKVPGLRGLVLYSLDENNARAFAHYLINDKEAKAIIVVDDCSLQGSAELRQLFNGHTTRLRAVVIDNRVPKNVSQAPELHLQRIPKEVVDQILALNFPYVAADRRRLYVELSGGFVRLAADLCSHDATILQRGDIGYVIPGVREYLRLRLDDANDLKTVQAISLLQIVGFKEDVASELEELCQWIGLDKSDVLDRVTRLKDSPGFIAIGGRYLYITPKIIADVAFQDAWERWFAADPNGLLSKIPAILTEPFQRRIAASGDVAARRAAADFFRRWAAGLTIASLADHGNLDRILALGETDPDVYLPLISNLILNGSLDDLRSIDRTRSEERAWRWGPRRYLVWFLERIAAFPEYFRDAEAALFRLALAESEPGIANNATGVWRQLFRPLLSGTAVPFAERLSLLRQRLFMNDQEAQALGVAAVESCLASLFGVATRDVGPQIVAGRIVPDDWRPKTYAELWDCLDKTLELVTEMASSTLPTLRAAGERIALAHVRQLVAANRLQALQQVFTPDRLTSVTLPKLLEHIEQFLEYDTAGAQGRPPVPEEYVRQVRQWQRALIPKDFHGRLASVIGKEPWHHRVTGGESEWLTEVIQIAEQLVKDRELFARNIDWLCSEEAKSAVTLGVELGKLDSDANYSERILIACGQSGNSALGRGYVAGLLEQHPRHLEGLNRLFDELEEQSPRVAFEMCLVGGQRTHAIQRVLRLVDKGRLDVACLDVFSTGVEGRPLNDTELCDVLKRFIDASMKGNEQAVRRAISFLGLRLGSLKNDAGVAFSSDQSRKLAWKIIEAAASSKNVEPHWWSGVLEALSHTEPARAARIASLTLAENFVLSGAAEGILAKIARANAQIVMDELGQVVLHPKLGIYFFVGLHRGIINALPVEVVKNWLSKAGVEGARRLARHLPVPFLDPNGQPIVPPLTEFVLTRFENDDRTFHEFCAGVGSFRSYVGPMAPQKEGEAEVARKFLSHPLRRIREWARGEIDAATQQAEYWRQFDEELKIR
jgi:hypothetical protein